MLVYGCNGRELDGALGCRHLCRGMCVFPGVKILEPSQQPQHVKLVTFVPIDHCSRVVAAMHESGAGSIGDYHQCSFSQPGTGRFCGGATTTPALGKPGWVPLHSLSPVTVSCQDGGRLLCSMVSHQSFASSDGILLLVMCCAFKSAGLSRDDTARELRRV